MSWRQPGRARHLVIVSEQGPTREYSRAEDEEDVWFEASGFPNPTVFRAGPTMTSGELVDVLREAIAGLAPG